MKKIDVKPRSRVALYFLILLAALILMWMLRQCSSDRSGNYGKPQASGADTIDVAIEYSPVSIYTFDDTLGGFNYDLMRMVAAEAGLKVKFHYISSVGDALEMLRDGIYDVVVADYPQTLESQDSFRLTVPVYIDRQVLVQRTDSSGQSSVASALDLAGMEVWVAKGTPAVARLHNLASEIGDTIKVVEDSESSSEQLFLLTAIGEIPRAVVNEKVARRLVREYSNINITTNISFSQFQSWVMRKDERELTDTLNAVIERCKTRKEYERLLNRYFR